MHEHECTPGAYLSDALYKKSNRLKQVETFKYLGSVISEKGGFEEEVDEESGDNLTEYSTRGCQLQSGSIYKTVNRRVQLFGSVTYRH